MVEVYIWLIVLITIFGGYGLEAFLADIVECYKKKNWKYPVAVSLFMIVFYFVMYGVIKCINL